MPRLLLGFYLLQIKKAAVTCLHSKNAVSPKPDMIQQRKIIKIKIFIKHIIVKTIWYKVTNMCFFEAVMSFSLHDFKNAGGYPLAVRWQQ